MLKLLLLRPKAKDKQNLEQHLMKFLLSMLLVFEILSFLGVFKSSYGICLLFERWQAPFAGFEVQQ
jgi:hypothetical protein